MKSLNAVPNDKKTIRAAALGPLKETVMKRAAKGDLRWVLCDYPTDAAAQECKMDLASYEEFIFKACFLHKANPIKEWETLSQKQAKIVQFLNKKSDFRFVGDDTVDVGILNSVGLSVVVPNCNPTIDTKLFDWVTKRHGGYGAIRDVCDLIYFSKKLNE